MNEMKFLLAGRPRKDSVWLHLGCSALTGISLWRGGKLARLDYPACWLSCYLWLVKTAPIAGIKQPDLSGGPLTGLLRLAFKDAVEAALGQDHELLAESMCTICGYQGAPRIKFTMPGTLGRMYAVDYFSHEPYIIGVTQHPILKTVLQ